MKKEKEIAKSNLEMLKSYAKEFIHHAMELQKALKKETEIDAWVVAKAERATTDLSDITHYLDGKSEYAKGGKTSKVNNYLYEIATPMPAKVLAKKLEDLSERYKVIEGSYKSPENLESVVMINLTSQDIATIQESIDEELVINEIPIPENREFSKGGKLEKKATYVPKRDIAEVEVEKNGKTKYVDGADLIDGVYVKKSKYDKGGQIPTGKKANWRFW